jgi:hypothetical protein
MWQQLKELILDIVNLQLFRVSVLFKTCADIVLERCQINVSGLTNAKENFFHFISFKILSAEEFD